ncbi:heterokaryon incompatibility protein-domain-containing protein [Ilyonectria sp. MPI-CAGE-AT-0026]|nr:heterokaryon incompatibility protein-domain-containing protein [Ilyonectria sp. MPI-CAGE-AT-0026]
MLIQRSVPKISELEPQAAWFSLDTRPKDHGTVTLWDNGPHFIRIWLSAAYNGRTICHTLLHELSRSGQPEMGRQISPQINISLLQQWLHLEPQPRRLPRVHIPSNVLKLFSVIDIKNKRLVSMSSRCRYTTLSYVWGGNTRNRSLNTRATVGHLHKKGSIRHDDLTLPGTIRDAIDLCHRLDVRYLWIDSLCITQDDKASKDIQIQHMDAVYRSATFTIVAASGRNAGTGLPGLNISNPRRICQQSAEIDGVPLVSRPPRPTIEDEIWATRAWTLQEDYLSRRKLIFCDNLVVFRTSYEKESFDLEENAHPLTSSVMRSVESRIQSQGATSNKEDKPTAVFLEYKSLVEDYSKRRHTDSGDIIKAFSGLLRHLSVKYQTSFVQGLPVSSLELSLLWLPTSQVVRRTDPSSGTVVAPSWSWAGWDGSGVQYELIDPVHLGRITWEDAEIAKLREGICSAPTRQGGQQKHQQRQPKAVTLAYEVLGMSALCAKFLLRGTRIRLGDFGEAKGTYKHLRTYVIEDCEGNFAGAVCLHDPDIDPEYTMDRHIGPFELVAVTRTGPATWDDPEAPPLPPDDDLDLQNEVSRPRNENARPYERDYRDEYMEQLRTKPRVFMNLETNDPYFFCKPYRRFYDYRKSWSIYHVLVIVRKGDLAYRVGVGRCVAEAFWRNGAEEKLVHIA